MRFALQFPGFGILLFGMGLMGDMGRMGLEAGGRFCRCDFSLFLGFCCWPVISIFQHGFN
jgi:hypothetical protein